MVAELEGATKIYAGRRIIDRFTTRILRGDRIGVVDEHLQAQGLSRHIMVRSPHFGLAPAMVARAPLVLTTGRQFCSRYIGGLPVRIVRCPVDFPPLTYYQLWHDLTHASPAVRWLREQVREVARNLAAGKA